MLTRIVDGLNSKKDFPWVIVTPLLYAVGNAAEEVYFGHLKARRENRRLILMRPYYIPFLLDYRLCNKELFDLDSEYCQFHGNGIMVHVFRLLLTVLFTPSRLLSLFFRKTTGFILKEKYNFPRMGFASIWQEKYTQAFSWETVNALSWESQFSAFLDIRLRPVRNEQAVAAFKQLGLKDSDWFVCLHVRESGFRNDAEKRPYRNSDIMGYLSAIKEITSRGGWVIRMGDDSMKKLPEMERVIDYPFSKYKSALMDLYLIKNCRFYLGCQSGILDVAFMFQKPVVMVNMYNLTFGYPMKRGDVGIIKHFYSKLKKRYLSSKELLSAGWEVQNTEGFLDHEYILKENLPEEIKQLVIEYLDHKTLSHESIQIKANKMRVIQAKKSFKKYDASQESITKLPVAEQFRYASRLEAVNGCLGLDYLKKTWDHHYLNNKGNDPGTKTQ
ncbi:MAG: TIGR04372 family glycosyltransferase [Pseudomonadota bacterium]